MKATTIGFRVLALTALFAVTPAHAENGQGSSTRTAQRTDFLNAAYLPGLDRIVVTGQYGLVGMLEIGETDARLVLFDGAPNEDYTAMARVSDDEVLIGSSTGRLYRFDGKAMTEIAALSEYEEPVLDIAADGSSVWVVGARGLIAHSKLGDEFENIEIRGVEQPRVEFPAAQAADWYFGVSNIDVETIAFEGFVNGEPAVEEEHYIMFPDEGFVQFQTALDASPAPAIAFKFDPGPPFRAGDVSWNEVMAEGGTVTIAGEFGMILQSEDNGESWVRRDTELVPREPEPAYWLAGVQDGLQMWLTGAAGVTQRSMDGGKTWIDVPKPGREGIFGVMITESGAPLISGAVGLIGVLEGEDWQIADRTRLKLLSWLKTPTVLPDGTIVVTGGRATAIRYADGEFTRLPVRF